MYLFLAITCGCGICSPTLWDSRHLLSSCLRPLSQHFAYPSFPSSYPHPRHATCYLQSYCTCRHQEFPSKRDRCRDTKSVNKSYKCDKLTVCSRRLYRVICRLSHSPPPALHRNRSPTTLVVGRTPLPVPPKNSKYIFKHFQSLSFASFKAKI